MTENYWQTTLRQHLSRRRAIAATGATALGAALLAACGGDEGAGDGDATGLLTKPVDTSKEAKRGGTLKRSTNSDPAGLDPHGGGASVASFYEIAYARLFNYKSGYLEASKGEFEGAIAESWEWSPDRLQLTAKLRPNVRFHNLPPVNGRAMDIDDINFSWQRFSSIGSNRTVVANSANPDAPVMSVTTPDARTVVVKFKEPLVYAQAYLTQRGYLSVVPKEAENQGTLDLRQRMLGTGPAMLSDYQASVSLNFQRHPEYWDKEHSYIERTEYPIVSEYATGLAQFRSGHIHNYTVRQEDILITKRDEPRLLVYEKDYETESRRTVFGWQTPALRDKRVRQAMSMSVQRDDWIAAQYATDTFTAEGLPIETRWNTALQGNESNDGWWLDPKGKDFGPNAKYFQLNVAEAKKLLAAAGFADGLEIISNHFTTTENGVDYVKFIDLFESMATEAGFRFKKNIIAYQDYLRSFRDSHGAFPGTAYKLGPGAPSDDPSARLTYEFSTKGGVGFHGFDVAGKGDESGDPYVEAELTKARTDFDTEKRRAIIFELQRYLADQMYTLRWPGGATGFDLIWPAIKNYRVYRAGPNLTNVVALTTWWLDNTQPPFV
jgi:peptide/nickel transport system substrate-binding protein